MRMNCIFWQLISHRVYSQGSAVTLRELPKYRSFAARGHLSPTGICLKSWGAPLSEDAKHLTRLLIICSDQRVRMPSTLVLRDFLRQFN